jgi:hypothetical protein
MRTILRSTILFAPFILLGMFFTSCGGPKTDRFLIGEHSIGGTSIGDHDKAIHDMFSECKFEKVEAWAFGVDGGGKGTVVKGDSGVLFFYWTHEGEDTVRGFIALNPKFHTGTGIHPGMTVNELKKIEPDLHISVNAVYDSENIFLKKEALSLVFISQPEKRVGIYKNTGPDESTTEMRGDARVDQVFVE